MPFLLIEGEHAALQKDVGVRVGYFCKHRARFRSAAVVLVRHRQQVKRVRILIAGLDGLFKETNRLGPVRLGNGDDRDNFLHVGHSYFNANIVARIPPRRGRNNLAQGNALGLQSIL